MSCVVLCPERSPPYGAVGTEMVSLVGAPMGEAGLPGASLSSVAGVWTVCPIAVKLVLHGSARQLGRLCTTGCTAT